MEMVQQKPNCERKVTLLHVNSSLTAALSKEEGAVKWDRPRLKLFVHLRGFGQTVVALNTHSKSALGQ